MSATREAMLNSAVLIRTPGEAGLPNTRLALACHATRQAGLPVQEIIKAMADSMRPFAETGRKQIEPSDLYGVMREFQTLPSQGPVGNRGSDAKATFGQDLLEVSRLIVAGAFREYGHRFARLEARTHKDIEVREPLDLRRLGRRGSSWGGGAS